jgi:hypothetical protein
MPTSKKRQTAADAQLAQVRLTQLRAEGFDFGPDAEAQAELCPLEITEGRDFGIATDLGFGVAAYALSICLVARSPVTLEECYVAAPWDECFSGPLPFLKEARGKYWLGHLSYPIGAVLNDYFEKPYRMRRGATLEGMLLATGDEPIPNNVIGGVVPLHVMFVDNLKREVTKTIPVSVRRPSTFSMPVKSYPRERIVAEPELTSTNELLVSTGATRPRNSRAKLHRDNPEDDLT